MIPVSESSPRAVGFVYFIETEGGQYVKIGYSAQPYRRLSQLGTLRPGRFSLRIIGWMPGSIDTERWLHKKFQSDRDKGEWFRDSPGLRLFIRTIGLIEPHSKPERTERTVTAERKPKPVEGTATSPEIRRVFSMMGKRGGAARAESLSPERRKEIAKKAAAKRWGAKRKKGPSTPSKRRA